MYTYLPVEPKTKMERKKLIWKERSAMEKKATEKVNKKFWDSKK